jgi:hypothetical protein
VSNDRPAVPKIFGIGFGKTGTRSLDSYLRSLGYKSIHWPSTVDGIDYEGRVAPFIDDPARILDEFNPILDEYDAFTDVPFPGLYRALAERYRDARFILMTRDLERWWQSVASHWRLAWGPHRLEPYLQIQYRPYLPGKTVATLSDKAIFIEAHKQHIRQVKTDLAGRSMVCVDLGDPNLAGVIAGFLGVAPVPFPHVVLPRGPKLWLVRARMLLRKHLG